MKQLTLWGLLVIAAVSRIVLQVAAMPPYAGLDEIQHVARLVFVAREHRNPTTREASIAPYLEASIEQRSDALPSFAQIGERWPEVVRSNPHLVTDQARDDGPYVRANYEAQQPSIYYSLFAPFRGATPLDELRIWRLISGALALVIVLATAAAGRTMFGPRGIAAAALLLFLPTWFTLVVRAGNDALACAFLACAFAVTARSPKRGILEGLLWAGAFATKLYTWPAAIVLPLMWRRQRASRARVATVVVISALAVGFTIFDLSQRTSNSLGVVAFDRPGGASYEAGVNLSEIFRVTIASAAWTSGQHWNAMTPVAMAIYLIPVLALLVSRRPSAIAVAALAAFALAQAFNVISCVLARRAGNPVPIGGKEGWYWYCLAPILIATIIPPLVDRWRAAALSVFVWMAAWDVVITEGALFHDYAGATSPAHRSLFFRWGPMLPPFTAELAGVAAGPLTSHVTLLRIVQLLAVAALLLAVTASASRAPRSAS